MRPPRWVSTVEASAATIQLEVKGLSPERRCAICGGGNESNRVCDVWSSFTGAEDFLCARHEREVHAELRRLSDVRPESGP